MSTDYIKALLAEAEKAYHDLMVGNKASVYVDQNGERVEFTRVDADKLLIYIQNLRSRIGGGSGSNFGKIGFAL